MINKPDHNFCEVCAERKPGTELPNVADEPLVEVGVYFTILQS